MENVEDSPFRVRIGSARVARRRLYCWEWVAMISSIDLEERVDPMSIGWTSAVAMDEERDRTRAAEAAHKYRNCIGEEEPLWDERSYGANRSAGDAVSDA